LWIGINGVVPSSDQIKAAILILGKERGHPLVEKVDQQGFQVACPRSLFNDSTGNIPHAHFLQPGLHVLSYKFTITVVTMS